MVCDKSASTHAVATKRDTDSTDVHPETNAVVVHELGRVAGGICSFRRTLRRAAPNSSSAHFEINGLGGAKFRSHGKGTRVTWHVACFGTTACLLPTCTRATLRVSQAAPKRWF